MRFSFNLLISATSIFAVGMTAVAQSRTYNLGATPSAADIRAWDTAVDATGKQLPPGNGTATEGEKFYAAKCAACHGSNGARGDQKRSANGGPVAPFLVGDKTKLDGIRRWPFATTVWDYIKKAMPPKQEGTLSADQVYSLTAFLLYRNGIIKQDERLDAKTLPQIEMPNRNNFIPAPWPDADMKRFHARCPLGVCP